MTKSFTLTKDQDLALIRVKKFFKDEDNPAIVVMGSAGTGKTTLLRYIVDYILDNHIGSIAAVAPTHKARRVLEKMLNNDRFLAIPSFTTASILGKMREHTYIGSHKYTSGSKQKMDRFDCFILDEVSMVGDKDLEEIIEYICSHDKKLILVGDHCQIPSPAQKLVREDNICYKPDSVAFEIANLCELKCIVRQDSDSIIVQIATYLRDHLMDEISITDILTALGKPTESVLVSHEDAYKNFNTDWVNGLDTRIIAYTNAAVRSHNTKIRTDLKIADKLLVEDELLTGYDNVGWPVPVIENGTDYKVLSIQPTTKHIIHGYAGLTGDLVDLMDIVDPTNISRKLFFISVRHSSNAVFMREFVKRAERVNSRNSTKDAYRRYCQLKNRAIFLEDVYKYGGKIMTETDFRQSQTLLFTKVSEVIDIKRKTIAVSELTKKLGDHYGEIIEGRLIDNKPFADGEVFADQYMVVEKDIYYGYALTAHKSQGSTYDSVYVDEHDFMKISNKWNYKFRAVEQRLKERNQLKYVAYTRASTKLQVMI
jgi:nucleoside-triphosphatase THEP1